MPTQNLTILFTDLQGFTARTSSETRAGVASLLAEHERLLSPVFAHYGGKVVKTIGDAFLVTFQSPTDAVVCGLAIQEVLRRHNQDVPEAKRLQVRVAINVGEVEVKDGDVFGEPVNLAARLESITEAGEVYFTEAVYLTMNRREAPSAEVGERTFKGIPGTVRIYKVVQDSGSEQLQQIAAGIALEQGQVKFTRAAVGSVASAPAPAAPGRGRNKLGIGLMATFMLGAVALGVFVTPILHERILASRAESLIDQGDRVGALELITKRLDADPANPRLREFAVKTAEQEAAAREKDHGAKDALDFVQAQLSAHHALFPLQGLANRLDAEVTVEDAIEHDHEYEMWETVRNLVRQKYRTDPDVPFVAAQRLEKRYIPESFLWLYLESFKRGHKVDPHVADVCAAILAENLPGTSEVKEAFDALDQYFPGKKLSWAKDALDHGTGMALANAWPLLAAQKDPRLAQPLLAAYHSVMADADLAPAAQTLAALTDPAQGRRAQKVIADALQRPNLTDAQRTALNQAADALKARFGEPPTENQ